MTKIALWTYQKLNKILLHQWDNIYPYVSSFRERKMSISDLDCPNDFVKGLFAFLKMLFKNSLSILMHDLLCMVLLIIKSQM